MPKVIDEISTSDLIDELMNRCNTACFIGTRNEGAVEGDVSWWQIRGHPAHCYGLIQHLALIVQARFIKEELRDDDT